MQKFLKAKKKKYLHVRDRNSHQKLLPRTQHRMKQLAVILLTMMKPTARIQPQPTKKYKVIPNSLDKIVVSLI